METKVSFGLTTTHEAPIRLPLARTRVGRFSTVRLNSITLPFTAAAAYTGYLLIQVQGACPHTFCSENGSSIDYTWLMGCDLSSGSGVWSWFSQERDQDTLTVDDSIGSSFLDVKLLFLRGTTPQRTEDYFAMPPITAGRLAVFEFSFA